MKNFSDTRLFVDKRIPSNFSDIKNVNDELFTFCNGLDLDNFQFCTCKTRNGWHAEKKHLKIKTNKLVKKSDKKYSGVEVKSVKCAAKLELCWWQLNVNAYDASRVSKNTIEDWIEFFYLHLIIDPRACIVLYDRFWGILYWIDNYCFGFEFSDTQDRRISFEWQNIFCVCPPDKWKKRKEN